MLATLVEPDWRTARETAHRCANRLPEERISISSALGRTTSRSITAATSLPAVATSAMDGWAVRGPSPWRIVGEVRAGKPAAIALKDGEAVIIATGAAIPEGADAVLRSEDGSQDNEGFLSGVTEPGKHLRPAGEEAVEGDELIPAGTTFTPLHIGLLAAAGYDEVWVSRQPLVSILILGDELLHSGVPNEGLVRDALGPQVPAWLASWGCHVINTSWVDDTLEELSSAMRSSVEADVILTTGSTASGPVDHLHQALCDIGASLIIDTVSCRPGHPMLLAAHQGQRIVGLPGNPHAAVAGMFTLAKPLIDGTLGKELDTLSNVIIGANITGRGSFTRLVPSTLIDATAHPEKHIGSGMLRGLANADGFAVVEPGSGTIGDSVTWLPLR